MILWLRQLFQWLAYGIVRHTIVEAERFPDDAKDGSGSSGSISSRYSCRG